MLSTFQLCLLHPILLIEKLPPSIISFPSPSINSRSSSPCHTDLFILKHLHESWLRFKLFCDCIYIYIYIYIYIFIYILCHIKSRNSLKRLLNNRKCLQCYRHLFVISKLRFSLYIYIYCHISCKAIYFKSEFTHIFNDTILHCYKDIRYTNKMNSQKSIKIK